MSIQQAMNNMLFSVKVGAGLYAHSPAGNAQAEKHKLKATGEKLKREAGYQITGALKDLSDDRVSKEDFEKIENKISTYQNKEKEIRQKSFEFDPSEKTYNALKSLEKRISQREASFKAVKERMGWLKANKAKGTPGTTGIEEYLKGGKK